MDPVEEDLALSLQGAQHIEHFFLVLHDSLEVAIPSIINLVGVEQRAFLIREFLFITSKAAEEVLLERHGEMGFVIYFFAEGTDEGAVAALLVDADARQWFGDMLIFLAVGVGHLLDLGLKAAHLRMIIMGMIRVQTISANLIRI